MVYTIWNKDGSVFFIAVDNYDSFVCWMYLIADVITDKVISFN